MDPTFGFTLLAAFMLLFFYAIVKRSWGAMGVARQVLYVLVVALILIGAYVHNGPLALPLFLLVGLIVTVTYFLKPKNL